MKLDSRIIEGKKPLTCFDTEAAKQFIGKEGYFANCLRVFKTVEYFEKWTLIAIDEKEEHCFKDATGENYWVYFLPAEWVREKEPEPEWKPYDLDTWRNDNFRIGSAITFRIKPKKEQDSKNTIVKTMIYLGREEHGNDLNDVFIYLGTLGYSFKYLFESYEIFDDKYEKPGCPKWRPFGYQE